MISRLDQRSAYTLIEISVVTMIAGIIASSTAVVLRNAYLVHRDSLAAVVRMHFLDRLRDRFERDAAVALNARATDSLELQLASDTRIRYWFESGAIHREKMIGGVTASRDRWTFSAVSGIAASVDQSRPTTLVSLTVNFEFAPTKLDSWTCRARIGAWNIEQLARGVGNE